MNTNPTLSELIQTAINTVSRVEVILDRAEERERKFDALIEKFNAVFPDEDDEAETRWAPAIELPEPALPSRQTVEEWADRNVRPAPAGSLAAKPVSFTVLDEVHKYPDIGSAPLEPAVLDANGHKPTLDESMADACGFERPVPDAPRKNPSGPDRFDEAVQSGYIAPVAVATIPVAEIEQDPTLRDLPLDPSWPELPPLPAGMTRWVNRGDFRNVDINSSVSKPTDNVMYLHSKEWYRTTSFNGPFIHIQAISEPVAEPVTEPAPEPVAEPAPEPVAEPAPEPVNTDAKPRMIPEVGAYYWLRNTLTARILEKRGDGSFSGQVHGFDGDQWHPFFWHADGIPYGTGDPAWDLVQVCPF